MKRIVAIISILILILIGILVFHPIGNVSQKTSFVHPMTVAIQKASNTFSYNGQNGKDALTLLKQQASIQQDHSGLVVGINRVKPTGHEYWAFYINGNLASVGPAKYQTKKSDKILWKIEKY